MLDHTERLIKYLPCNMIKLCYKDTATLVKVRASEYGDTKVLQSEADVPVIFLQTTGFVRSNRQENVDADAICYPDPENAFIVSNHNRLEGMYLLAPLYGIDEDEGWYKVTRVSVNRNHLLGTQIDNIELTLKKTRRIPGVS